MRIYTARQALTWIFICSMHPFWETDKLIGNIGYLGYKYNYSGRWEEVQEYLEQLPNSPEQFLELYLSNHSPEEFFGNFLKDVNYELLKLHYVSDKSNRRLKTPKKPRSRREYCDKGTLRPDSDFHGDPPVKTRIDRRDKISHPLLGKNLYDESKKAGVPTSSQKGVILNDDRSRKTS